MLLFLIIYLLMGILPYFFFQCFLFYFYFTNKIELLFYYVLPNEYFDIGHCTYRQEVSNKAYRFN